MKVDVRYVLYSDELMVHQNILAGISYGNNLKDPLFIKLGAFSLQYMESIFWIKEVEDIDPEIQTTQKFLGHQQIDFRYRLGADNYFSGILTIDKVVDNFTSFPESTRTQKSEFVCEIYQQNTELDRDKSEPDVMTGWKRTR